MNEVLSIKPFNELRMLSKMPGEACKSEWAGNLCNSMPDEFFRFLVDEEIARRSDAAREKQATWDFWKEIGLFVIALVGATTGIVSLIRQKMHSADG